MFLWLVWGGSKIRRPGVNLAVRFLHRRRTQESYCDRGGKSHARQSGWGQPPLQQAAGTSRTPRPRAACLKQTSEQGIFLPELPGFFRQCFPSFLSTASGIFRKQKWAASRLFFSSLTKDLRATAGWCPDQNPAIFGNRLRHFLAKESDPLRLENLGF